MPFVSRHISGEEAAWFTEAGEATKEGEVTPMQGGVKIGKKVFAQNYVSIKKAEKEGEFTEIGDNTYLCSFVNVGHNVKLGKNCYIAPNTTLCGMSQLGDHVYVGANSVIVQYLKVGNWVKIRAGSVVDRDIPDNTYWGKNGKCVPNKYGPKNMRATYSKELDDSFRGDE